MRWGEKRGTEDDTHIPGLGDSWDWLLMEIQEKASMIVRIEWGRDWGNDKVNSVLITLRFRSLLEIQVQLSSMQLPRGYSMVMLGNSSSHLVFWWTGKAQYSQGPMHCHGQHFNPTVMRTFWGLSMKRGPHLFPNSDSTPLNLRPDLTTRKIGGVIWENREPPADQTDGDQNKGSGRAAVNGTHLHYVATRSGVFR